MLCLHSVHAFFWQWLCGTTSTTAHSLGKTAPTPRPRHGHKTQVTPIRSLLLSPLSKNSPLPLQRCISPLPFSIYSYSQGRLYQPHGFKCHLHEFKPYSFKYRSLAQTSPLNPDCPLACPTACSWHFHLVSLLTYPHWAPNPSKPALSCSLFDLKNCSG